MSSVLALDLGTRTGWALRTPDGDIAHGYADFRPQRYEGGGMRYLRFQRWLDEINASWPITEIHFEEVRRHAGTDAAHCYGGLLGVLSAWCETRNVPYRGHPVAAIKKHWTGKGNANKDAMLAEAKARGWVSATDDNEVDALAILHLHLEGAT